MLWLILELIIATFALLLIYAWFKPNNFRIERTIVINAPTAKVHAHLANFRKWTGWSPWEALDPNMKRTFEGAAEGVGAAYSWEGKKAGCGDMLITKSDPATGISLDLNFTKPMKANNKTDITLSSEAEGTRVKWAMYGPQPFLHRVMATFFSMDKMVGKDFEKGLAQLKAVSEK